MLERLIEELDLEPIPDEGGWFRRVFTGPLMECGRPRYTSIYALFTREQFSAFHRLDADELFLYHGGDPFELFEFKPDGSVKRIVLGNNVKKGHVPQYVFEEGNWFGGMPLSNGPLGYSLMSCVVTPGFTYEGFELGNRENLCREYPDCVETIHRLTRSTI